MNHSVESYRERIIAEIKDHFEKPGDPSHIYSLLKEFLECQPRHFDERLNELSGKLAELYGCQFPCNDPIQQLNSLTEKMLALSDHQLNNGHRAAALNYLETVRIAGQVPDEVIKGYEQLQERLKQSAEVSEAKTEDFDPWEIDVEMAEAHLAAVGIGPDDPVILCAYGSTNKFVPDRFDFYPAEVKQEFAQLQKARKTAEESGTPADVGKAEAALKAFNESQYVYDWEKVTAAHKERVAQGLGRDWDRIRQLLRSHRTPNLGYIGGIGGTSIKKRQEILRCKLLPRRLINTSNETTRERLSQFLLRFRWQHPAKRDYQSQLSGWIRAARAFTSIGSSVNPALSSKASKPERDCSTRSTKRVLNCLVMDRSIKQLNRFGLLVGCIQRLADAHVSLRVAVSCLS